MMITDLSYLADYLRLGTLVSVSQPASSLANQGVEKKKRLMRLEKTEPQGLD